MGKYANGKQYQILYDGVESIVWNVLVCIWKMTEFNFEDKDKKIIYFTIHKKYLLTKKLTKTGLDFKNLDRNFSFFLGSTKSSYYLLDQIGPSVWTPQGGYQAWGCDRFDYGQPISWLNNPSLGRLHANWWTLTNSMK